MLALYASLLTYIVPISSAKNTIYYVAKNGNDKWSGKLAEPNEEKTDGPFASIDKAKDAIRELKKEQDGLEKPVTVLVRDGKYHLEQTIVFSHEDSGTELCPVTYMAYPGENVVLSGGKEITGWQKGEGNLWKVEIPQVKSGQWYFRQLFINGNRRHRARLPKDGYYEVAGIVNPDSKEAQENRTSFQFRPGDIKKSWTNLQDVEVIKLFSWSATRLPITQVDEETNTVFFPGECSRSSRRPFNWHGTRYYVENVYEGLDTPGEWYLNRETGILYYYPMPDEDMEKIEATAPVLEQLVRFEGKPEAGLNVENIRLKNLNLSHSSWNLPKEGYPERQAQVIVNTAAIYANGAVSCILENLDISRLGTHGIWFEKGCKNNQISHCHIHDVGAGGIYIGSTELQPETIGNRVDNNFVHHCCELFHGAILIWIGRSSYNSITHNEICDSDYTGISVGWSWGFALSSAHHNLIEYNHIHHCGHEVLSDMGGIYTLGVSPGTQLRYNLIHDIHSYPTISHGSGIYPDEGSSDILIENNIVYRVTTSGFFQHYGRENIVRNNIFAFSENEGISRCREEEHISFYFKHNIVYSEKPGMLFRRWSNDNYVNDYNLYWSSSDEPLKFNGMTFEEWQAKGHDIHSIIADPRFKNPAGYDFSIESDSPAIKIGFKPIDTSRIGVYGEPDWINLPKTIVHRPDGPITSQTKPTQADGNLFDVGVAQIDITPEYPIRLSGYGGRREESEGVAQRIWAKALAIGSDEDGAAVIVTVENCGIPDYLTEQIATRLKNKCGIPREKFALCSTHTHSAPFIKDAIPFLFSTDIPPEHQEKINRYTKELAGLLEKVALDALADRKPAYLSWTEGRANFALNRRNPEGPVDHAMPILQIKDAQGKLRAVWVNYACHCTTLGGDFNQICGDWAGYAQEYIQNQHPGVIALVSIGCGADANPSPRTGLNYAQQHGREIANEVERLLRQEMTPISDKIVAQFKRINLPYDKLPTLEEWKGKAKQGGPVGYHAQKQVERISQGKQIPTKLSYPVQTWVFGDDLAILFLAGEVVVDFSIRLKREFTEMPLWINAYSNDVPCYIPSKRILQEGGYEAGDAMAYFGRPTRFAPEVEDLIVSAVKKLLP